MTPGHRIFVVVVAWSLAGSRASADVVADWDARASEVTFDARMGAPPANRVMALVQTAVFEAVNAITRRYPSGRTTPDAPPGASVEAAVAAASRATLVALVPSRKEAIDATYQAVMAALKDGPGKTAGVTVGEKAAAAILAARADDGAAAGESYRPLATPGAWVPTTLPVVPQWPQRKPWLMTGPAQFRPGPPPGLTSERWARDYAEVKELGGKTSARRTPEQTEIARFWEATGPSLYHGVVRSIALSPGREVTQNARLYAAVTQATDDAMIAVFDAKYRYGFWRPITAIRNGDLDGNDATDRDPSWTPFIDTPMHPEYPCAHCIVAGAVGAVLRAEVGSGVMPTLTTTSPTAIGGARSWTSIDDFVAEVSAARIYDGVHYRNSAEVGAAMGRQIGALAAERLLRKGK
jgi:PAP2 superfamily